MKGMAPGSKLIVGALLAVAVGIGLWGTFDYTRDSSTRAETNPVESPRAANPGRLERGRFIADARPLRGTRQLLNQLRSVGLEQAIVLRGATPKRLSVTFTGEQDVSARTFYEANGRTVSVGQIFGAPLPPAGGLVRLSPDRTAVEVDDVLYWSERGYILTIAAESQGLVERLRWRSAGNH
jgi:hypothetical protein